MKVFRNVGALAAVIALAETVTAQCLVTEWAKLTPPAAVAGDRSGTAVALSGDVLVVGAPYATVNGIGSGAADVFRRVAGVWTHEVRLAPSVVDGGDEFGKDVDVDGDTIVVGAHNGGGARYGYVFVYRHGSSGWTEEAHFRAANPGINDHIGYSVAIDGDWIVSGGPGYGGALNGTGAAWVFHRQGTEWSQHAHIVAADAAEQDNFGWSVDISGDRVIIGSILDDGDDGVVDQGSAYIYARTGAVWVQQAKLRTGDYAQITTTFGRAVAIEGDLAYVGGQGGVVPVGWPAYVHPYMYSGTSWVRQPRLDAPGNGGYAAIGMSGDIVLVGRGDGHQANVYRHVSGSWVNLGCVGPSDSPVSLYTSDNRVCVNDGTAAIGSPGTPTVVGAVYVFEQIRDCNLTDLLDGCDLAAGTSQDCNSNGTPDECELAGNDCNANGIPDECDLAAGTSYDNNENGIPDECDLVQIQNFLECITGPGVAVGQGCESFDLEVDADVDLGDFAAFQVAMGGPCQGGLLRAWGNNGWGQCNIPEPFGAFIALSAGSRHSLAVRADGVVLAWGDNSYGQLDIPVPNVGFVAVAAGSRHSLALRADGSLVPWGYNYYGQTSGLPSPNAGFVAIAEGHLHCLALRGDGSIAAWGANFYGQSNVPAPNAGFVAVAAASNFSLGLKSNGSIIAWGDNPYGQCNVPTPNSDFVAIAAGGGHGLGLKSDGSIVAWGLNGHGQCNVPSPNQGWDAIAGGGQHSLARRLDGSVAAWGDNSYGQCSLPDVLNRWSAFDGGDLYSMGIQACLDE